MTNSEIITALKSGEYDGTHIMQAWCRIRQQQERIAELEKAILEIDGGHSYNDTFLKIDEAVSLVNKGEL